MKRFGIKRLMTVVLSVLIAAMLSTSVLAAYVPTVVSYIDSEGKPTVEMKMSFKKNGNINKITYYYSSDLSESETYTYKWKGNRLIKEISPEHTYTYKYKNGVLKSQIFNSGQYTNTTTYTWKKKTATPSYSNSGDPGFTIKRNSKKQLSKEIYNDEGFPYSYTYKYYGNGNLKSYTLIDSDSKYVVKFNKNGYIVSVTNTEDGQTSKTTYKYKMDKKKKCPKSVTITYSDGDKYTYKFTKFKKVKQSKNCDAWGHRVPLGVNIF